MNVTAAPVRASFRFRYDGSASNLVVNGIDTNMTQLRGTQFRNAITGLQNAQLDVMHLMVEHDLSV